MASSLNSHSALEREKIPIPLGPNRDKMCPDLYWAIDHPAVPIPNRVLIMESDLSAQNMEAVFQWEENQTIPNFATDEQLAEEGRFHVPWEGGVLHFFARHRGSLNAYDDSLQGWFTPHEVFPAHLKANLHAAIEQAMGPEEHVTLNAPKRNNDGTLFGGIALERGGEGRSKPVKPGTRCYTMANSHETARQTWGPTVNAKVYESFDNFNKMTHDLIVAAAEMGKFANEQAPPEVYEFLRLEQTWWDSGSGTPWDSRGQKCLPLSYGLRIDSDRFLSSFSFEVEPGVRESVAPWEDGPGFRRTANTSPNAPALNNGSDLISQDVLRSNLKRRYRLHYNKLARHIPYAFMKGKAYEIDEAGNLLEDTALVTQDLGYDALGNPIERGGRPWPKPKGPKTHSIAARKEKADRKAKAARTLELAAGKAPLRRSKRKMKTPGGNSGPVNISLNHKHEPGAIWATPAYSALGNALSSSEPGQLGAVPFNASAVSDPTPMLEDVDDPMEFLNATVEPEPSHNIKFIQQLSLEVIMTDFSTVVDASQCLAESNFLKRSVHLELAIAGMVNDPISVETCLHISHAWTEIRDLHALNAETLFTLKLERQSIMQTTCAFWTWLDGLCGNIIEHALTPSLVDPPILPMDWISRLTRHVHMLLQTRGPPRELLSQDFGAGTLNGTYAFPSRRGYDIQVSPEEVKGQVINVLAYWLNFPMDSDSHTQAWFIEACRSCNPALLFLDCTWSAFCHVDVEVFGRRRTSKLPPSEAYTRVYNALGNSKLADPRSQESLLLAQIEQIISEFQVGATQQQAAALVHNAPASQEERHHTPDPPPLLTLAEDLVQLQMMNRFLTYLLQLEPLIDGFSNISDPSLLQSTVAQNLDFLLPFREHGPSRTQARGPGCAFDPLRATTKTGLFNGLLFRGVTFSSPFGREPTTLFFDSPSAFTTACAKYPDAASEFFCNPYAYSRRKSKRSISLVGEYWEAVMERGHGEAWETMAKEAAISFTDCYKFLSKGHPNRFKEIGSLAGFLLAADFVYAGVVAAPTAQEVGTIIREINKGAVNGLELLRLIAPRTQGAQRGYRMANMEEVRAKFVRLYDFLDQKLTDAQKVRMVFDAIMVENGLCKMTRVVKLKVYVL
ncbi:hypothetical protein GGX14DRAFT_606870 [Mycena pura]|uniref:Uncharacterized protein n=1 Tax=Mycena pura TaxID=153505 RepID=A0AAD6YDU6_9AGAR|nr:hypothetical protein GGX14DRAFT_606870 [Mycena pura]